MRKIFASVAVAAALMLGSAGAASAAPYPAIEVPGTTFSMPISTSTTFSFANVPNGTYVFTVTNPATGNSVTFELTKTPDNGVMVFEFTAPTAAGVLNAVVTGPQQEPIWNGTIDVTATTDSGELGTGGSTGGTTTDSGELAAGDELANTGASNMGMIAVAGGLLVAGAGAVGIVARRREAGAKVDATV
ncbi:LPXTG cell wall anchor domain-containing protein [Demequina zhanjiangensis]|uniref:LPXTG cell wall anchor domain-containing protein n=1 Tax=Demequina zhanjiangensis TaxID=3051659 RepID=A0ABT8FYR4_9MICO|nr:LPXTG cell wall anchor domain-containing protein [Demequina sp. SYSU T00b26]MDN4472031.1 LPXTG cell wall anchor domain-containing protein [Demequina sp. SYSU T00b26]